MKMKTSVVLGLLKLAALSIPVLSQGSTPKPPTISVDGYPSSTLEATAWALVYTYPIQIFANFAGSVLSRVGVNEIFHQRNLASVGSAAVIKPNVDTIYSRVVLDLSTQDVVLTIPPVTGDRYYVFPVLDLFGNVISEIGVVNGNKAGKYLIRRADDVAVPPGFSNSSAAPNNSSYQGVVNLPTSYGTLLIRYLLFANTTEELEIVHKYQNASNIVPIKRSAPSNPKALTPSLNSTALNGSFLGIDTPTKQFAFAAKFLAHNQPENYTDRYRVATILAQAGLYNGKYNPVKGINLTQAAVIANRSITADVNKASNVRQQGNGWQLQSVPYQGNYGTNYAPRAYVALTGYQQQTVRQTLYPGWNALGFTTAFTLPEGGSVLVTFSGKPPLKRTGFWSLTMYGSDQYLIPNSENRYEVGDRTTSLVYQGSGDKVYGPDADEESDGPFQVLVQDAAIVPPKNWTSNWLPASPKFTWIVRWYTPEDAITNGTYTYPLVQNITAIEG